MPDLETKMVDGDTEFYGVIARGDPASLPPGYVPEAINYRFREGTADPRRGTVRLPWLNKISGTSVLNWSSVQGAGQYRDPDKRIWDMLAVEGLVYACSPNNPPRSVALPSGVTLPSGITFVQLGQTLVLIRGETLDPLQLTDLAVGFVEVPDPVVPGMSRIPPARRATVAGGRLWLITADDQVWASDVLDISSYHPLHQFVIGNGAQALVAMIGFGDTDDSANLLVMAKRSVYRLTRILSSDSDGILTQTKAPLVTSRYGCSAAESVVDCGDRVRWLCEEGIPTLKLTDLGVIKPDDELPMLSDPIQPFIQRIRFDYAQNAAGAYWDGKLYMAVPLDEGEVLQWNVASGLYVLGQAPVTVVAGATYRYSPGSAETSLENGADTHTGPVDFVAASGTVTLNGTGSVTAEIVRVFKGVNSAVLVYDFKGLKQAWNGYDQGEGLTPVRWFKTEYNRRERLHMITVEGAALLYEEGFEDVRRQPYLDLTLDGELDGGFAGSFSVNGGTTQNFNFAQGFNTLNNLGLSGTLANDRRNLWGDQDGIGFADGTFTAPDALRQQIASGVRFYATDGSVPAVTLTLDPDDEDALVAVAQRWQPIETRLVTRGYRAPDPLGSKRSRVLVMHVAGWAPTYSAWVRAEGVNEDTVLVEDQTRSRLVYDKPAHTPDWDPSNVNDDFATAHRQDYALILSTAGFKLGAGLQTGLHQQTAHRRRSNVRARAHQLVVTNSVGRLKLLACGIATRSVEDRPQHLAAT